MTLQEFPVSALYQSFGSVMPSLTAREGRRHSVERKSGIGAGLLDEDTGRYLMLLSWGPYLYWEAEIPTVYLTAEDSKPRL